MSLSQEKELHSGVRHDFLNTETGVVKKINVVPKYNIISLKLLHHKHSFLYPFSCPSRPYYSTVNLILVYIT